MLLSRGNGSGLFQRFKRQPGIFPVTGSAESSNQFARFIADAYLAICKPLMTEHFAGFGMEEAPVFRFEEMNG